MRYLPWVLGVVVLTASGCLLRELREPEGEEGEARKVWSGRSYVDQTVVDREPVPSRTAAGFDSERVWGGYDDWEPAGGADPAGNNVYQLTTRYGDNPNCGDCPDPALVFRISVDGGATWNPDEFIFDSKRPQNDPMVEVGSDGAVYVAWLNTYKPGVTFLKSTDRGRSWSRPVSFTGPGKSPKWNDRPVLAISRDGKDVYVAFNASDSYVVASHDGGKTWGNAVKTNNDERYWFHNQGVVGPDGSVYFAAVDFSQDYTGDQYVSVLRSADGGKTFTTTRVETSAQMPDCSYSEGCYLGYFGSATGVAVDKVGKVMVAYTANDNNGNPMKLYVKTSTDGLAWSSRQEIGISTPGVNHLFPALAAGPVAGDFRVMWQDDRNGQNAWNTWYRRTTTGGATWQAEVRVSDLGTGAPYKGATGYHFPYGDYQEISVDNSGVTHLIWGEGESYTGPGGTWYTRGQ